MTAAAWCGLVCRLFSQLDTRTAGVLGLEYMRLWEVPLVIAMSCVIGSFGSAFIALNSTLVYRLRHYLIPHDSRYRFTHLQLHSVSSYRYSDVDLQPPVPAVLHGTERRGVMPRPLPDCTFAALRTCGD